MNLEQVIKLLNNKGWTDIAANQRYFFFKPPAELGFNSNYTLPVPRKKEALDFEYSLSEVAKVLSEVYETPVSYLFMEVDNYLSILKKDAIYFKLASSEPVFKNTLEVEGIWRFLRNLSNSFNHYTRVKFREKFAKKLDQDNARLNQAVRKVLEYSSLRLVDLDFDSFCVGVSCDVIMGNEKVDVAGISEWRKELFPQFKKEVLEIDFHSSRDMDRLLKQFGDEERSAIFKPIIDVINEKSHTLYITDLNFEPQKTVLKIPQSTLNVLFPIKEKESPKPEFDLMQIVVPIAKDKNKIVINRSQIEHNLFAQTKNEFDWTEASIESGDRSIDLKKAITFHVKKDPKNSSFQVNFDPLHISFETENYFEIRSKFGEKFFLIADYYTQDINRQPSKDEVQMIAFLESVLPEG